MQTTDQVINPNATTGERDTFEPPNSRSNLGKKEKLSFFLFPFLVFPFLFLPENMGDERDSTDQFAEFPTYKISRIFSF